MFSTLLFLAIILPAVVRASSSSDPACTSGHCVYHVSDSARPGIATASVIVHGSNSSIGDLRDGAGWHMLNCDSDGTARIYCTGQKSDCDKLHDNGANATVVRVDGCPGGPFKHVTNHWVHENQTVPADVASKVTRRAGEPLRSVLGLTLSSDFSAIDSSIHGPVNISVYASSDGHDAAGFTARALDERWDVGGFANSVLNDATSAVAQAATAVENAVTGAATTIVSVATEGATAVVGAWATATSDIASAVTTPINLQNQSYNYFNVNRQFNNIDLSMKCSGTQKAKTWDAVIGANISAVASGTVSYSLSIVGTLSPPKFNDFDMSIGFTADMSSKITIANAGTFVAEGAWWPIFTETFAGIDIPDIISLGPEFQVNAQLTGAATSYATLEMDFAYDFEGVKVEFPSGSQSGTFTRKQSNITLSVAPGVAASGDIALHLIPALVFDVSVFDLGTIGSINFNLDASATLGIQLNKAANTGLMSGNMYLDAGLDVNYGFTEDFQVNLFGWTTFDVANYQSKSLYTGSWPLWSQPIGNINRREHSRDLFETRSVSLAEARGEPLHRRATQPTQGSVKATCSTSYPGQQQLENALVQQLTAITL